jgi:hypothetical protein
LKGQFKAYGSDKSSPFDIEFKSGACVSVKTLTAWSESGYGTPVRVDRPQWKIFGAVYLGKELFPEKLAIVPLHRLLKKEVFVRNAANRLHPKKATRAHPRFKWWPWLDNHLVPIRIKNNDIELCPTPSAAREIS